MSSNERPMISSVDVTSIPVGAFVCVCVGGGAQ